MKRIAVETSAIKYVTKHYKKIGYHVNSVEKENLGWDLNATYNDLNLKLEVKGLSGEEIAAELTSNEYQALKADVNNGNDSYRICIVTNALSKPVLSIFECSNEKKIWLSEEGNILDFEEKTAAKVKVRKK